MTYGHIYKKNAWNIDLWNEMQSMLCDNYIGVWLQWLTATPCMDMNIPENTLHEVSEQDILVTCFIHN